MRVNGYYWIRLNSNININNPNTELGWEVAYFSQGDGWYSIWEGGSYEDDEITEINEKRLLPH